MTVDTENLMKKHLFLAAVLGTLAFTGQASAQQFFGIGIVCPGGRSGGGYSAAPYSAAPYQAAPYFAAPYMAAPSAPYLAAPYQAAPYQAAPYQAAPYQAAPSAAPPTGNGDLVNAINNLTTAINNLAAKQGTGPIPKTGKTTGPAPLLAPPADPPKKISMSAERMEIEALAAEAAALRRGTNVPRDARAEIRSASVEAEHARAERTKPTAAGLAAR
jgi:hypothetical protein